jgi:hypothetical protein
LNVGASELPSTSPTSWFSNTMRMTVAEARHAPRLRLAGRLRCTRVSDGRDHRDHRDHRDRQSHTCTLSRNARSICSYGGRSRGHSDRGDQSVGDEVNLFFCHVTE